MSGLLFALVFLSALGCGLMAGLFFVLLGGRHDGACPTAAG
jgi:uncharacterized membrane protein